MRQIMFKQLQELQRKQQFQDVNDARNQDYANQLSSFKQGSAAQFAPTIQGTPVHDSQMFMVGNMQTRQHGGSTGFQGLPSGLVLSQSHNHALGPMGLPPPPQFDLSSYDSPLSNNDRNLNLYSHLQVPPSCSTKSNNSHSSFMNQQGNLSFDQISMQGSSLSLLPNQVFQERNLFGQVPAQSLNSNLLPMNYSQQGITMQRTASFHNYDGRQMSKPDTSLDPLEQTILFNTDDSIWESSFGRCSAIGTGGFDGTAAKSSFIDSLSSIQSGSWSALMQSAVTETSSSDTAMQEEWSGLSFQNPEPSTDNQPSSYINSDNLENNWVGRNMQNVSSPSSEPDQLFQKSNMNYCFPGFQQPGHQYLKQKDEFHPSTCHSSGQQSPRNTSQLGINNFEQKHAMGGDQLVQTSLSSLNAWPAQYNENLKNDAYQSNVVSCTNEKPNINYSGDELRGSLWLDGSASNSVSDGTQKPFDQVNQLNVHRYSVEPEERTPGENFEPMSAIDGVSSDFHCQDATAQSENMLELLNKDDISSDHTPGMQLNSKVSSLNELPLTESSVASYAKPCDTSPVSQGFGFRLGTADARPPQSYSFFPSLSMDSSSAMSLSSHHMFDYAKNQHPSPAVPRYMATKFPAYSVSSSQVNLHLKSANSCGPEFSLSENIAVTQPGASVMSQNVGFPPGLLATQLADSTTQQNAFYSKPYKLSPNLFQSPDSASSSLETSPGAQNEQRNKNLFKHDHSGQDFGAFSGKSGYSEQGSEKESYIREGSTEMHNKTSLSSTHTQESLRRHNFETDDIASGSRDNRRFGHSVHQNYPMLHQFHSPGNADTDGKRSPYDNYQAIANARELFLSGQHSVANDKPKCNPEATQPGSSSSGDNKGWDFSQEDHSIKASPAAYLQNFKQMELFGQNSSEGRSIGSNEASNAAYQSQISLQMAPSWFKQYGTLKDGQAFPMYNPKIANALSGSNIGNLQAYSTILQGNSADTTQGNDVCPPATLIASKLLSPPNMMLPLDVTCQNLGDSELKKRKIVSFDMVPWHKEVNHEAMRLQNISMVELEWAQASNRRQEEAKIEAEIVEDVLPVVRAKRRLIYTTQIMQQVFRPAPAVILFADATSNYDCVAYYAARRALGDACKLSGKLPSEANDTLPDKQTLKRTGAPDFSEVVEGLISQVKKLEDDLSRLDRSLSVIDIKMDIQELEKFSTINRFAKFHIRAHPSTVDPASPSAPSVFQQTNPQRYVIPVPMPKTVPEDIDCLSL